MRELQCNVQILSRLGIYPSQVVGGDRSCRIDLQRSLEALFCLRERSLLLQNHARRGQRTDRPGIALSEGVELRYRRINATLPNVDLAENRVRW